MNNIKYTDLLKEPRKTEPLKKTELLNNLNTVKFTPPQYVALTGDGSVGGLGKPLETETPIPLNNQQGVIPEMGYVAPSNGQLPTWKDVFQKDIDTGNPDFLKDAKYGYVDGGSASEGEVPKDNPATDGSGNTGGSTDGGGSENGVETKPMSYEEYILSLKSKADDTYKRSIINAQNTYDHSRSAYGANAAALGNMGLTGSGYSQYLDSKAYAQRSADMNAAQAIRSDAYSEADAKYMDYLNQKETAGKNAYMSLYEALTKDATSYSTADIDRIGAEMGLTPEQISGLKDVRGEQAIKYLDNNDYDKATLDQLFPEGGDAYQNYLNKLITESTDTVSSDMFEDYDKETASPLYREVLSLIESQIANTEEGSEEREKLDKTLETLNNAYNSAYNNPLSVSSNIKFRANSINAKNFADGDRFTITDGTNKYVVEGAGEADENVKTLASNNSIEDGTVFKYGGDYYIRVGNNYYKFKARSSKGDDWQAFTKAFNDEIKTKAED